MKYILLFFKIDKINANKSLRFSILNRNIKRPVLKVTFLRVESSVVDSFTQKAMHATLITLEVSNRHSVDIISNF